jgi:serine/threonine-protein kinase
VTNAPRYEPLAKIASGGMATVFVGAMKGPLGFEQLVAIKRPHEHLLEDPSFRDALIAEARLASRIHHANVVDVRDIEIVGGSIQLVMDYVEGAALGQLIAAAGRKGRRLPPGVVLRIALDACAGLSAVHDLADEDGRPLGLVHRDVSPQNILVGTDGVARITDFGVATAEDMSRTPTTQGTLKGKLGYMAPEYIRGKRPDRRADVFAMGVVLWEALSGRRLFKGTHEGETMERVLNEAAPPVGQEAPAIGEALDAIVARALEKDPDARFGSANELSAALEETARRAGLVATHAEVAREVREAVGEVLERRRKEVRARKEATDGAAPASRPRTLADDNREVEAATKKIAEPAHPASRPALHRSRAWLFAIPISLALAAAFGAGALLSREPAPSEVSAPSAPTPQDPPAPRQTLPAAEPSATAIASATASAASTASAAPFASAPAPRTSSPRKTPAPSPTPAARARPRPPPPNPYGR